MRFVDSQNANGQVLETLKTYKFSERCYIGLIMGLQAPWLEMIKFPDEEFHCRQKL